MSGWYNLTGPTPASASCCWARGTSLFCAMSRTVSVCEQEQGFGSNLPKQQNSGPRSRLTARSQRGRTRAVTIGCFTFGILLVVAYFVWVGVPFVVKDAVVRKKSGCMHNVRALMEALQMYLADNDDAFPPASTWCDALMSYVGSQATFVCPAAPKLRCSYAYLSGLAGLKSSVIEDPSHTVAIFESDQGWNAAGGAALLTKKPRHIGGDHYATPDGWVRWHDRSQAPKFHWQLILRSGVTETKSSGQPALKPP